MFDRNEYLAETSAKSKQFRKRLLECTFDVRRLRKQPETDFNDAWLKRKKDVSAWMTLPERYKGGAE